MNQGQIYLANPLQENSIISVPSSAYLHIPFCRRRCYYCDFPISVLGDKTNIYTSLSIQEYVEVLCQEILITPFYGKPLATIFFGGGTPSLLPPILLEKILKTLENCLGILSNAEISLEIDPGTFTREQLQNYQQAGVNRFSFGIQSFQDDLLEKCGRSHRLKDIDTTIELIHQVGIKNFSLDLISGLPHQTLDDWEFSLEKAIDINPPHLSCYDLVVEPVTAFGKQYKPGKAPLPTDEMTAQMYRLAQQLLTKAGYQHYEISNYAKSGYQCRHNRVYWENKSYYGFGMGAASYTNQKRFTRPRTRKNYYDWVNNLSESNDTIDCLALSKTDVLLETLMLGLRLREGINLRKLREDFGQKTIDKILHCLSPYSHQGWIEFIDKHSQNITLTKPSEWQKIVQIRLADPEGFLFSNTILSTLFEKLED